MHLSTRFNCLGLSRRQRHGRRSDGFSSVLRLPLAVRRVGGGDGAVARAGLRQTLETRSRIWTSARFTHNCPSSSTSRVSTPSTEIGGWSSQGGRLELIQITADDVTLDLHGFEISADISAGGDAVRDQRSRRRDPQWRSLGLLRGSTVIRSTGRPAPASPLDFFGLTMDSRATARRSRTRRSPCARKYNSREARTWSATPSSATAAFIVSAARRRKPGHGQQDDSVPGRRHRHPGRPKSRG